MITFKKIRWKNFLATGNNFIEVELNSNEKTLFVGKNGAGKSTMLDALVFALFKKPYRKINIPQMVNSINNKGLLVEIEFSKGKDNYLIRRGMKPNKFEIYKNDELIKQEGSVNDYQNMLENNILHMNEKSFTQIVILGNARFTAFMNLDAAKRRAVVEDVLDINIFSTMNTILKDKISDNKAQIKDLENDVNLLQTKVDMQSKYVNSAKTQNKSDYIEEQIEDKQRSIEEAQKNIDEIQEQMDNIDVGDTSKIDDKLEKYKEFNVQAKGKISNLRNTIEFFQENDVCPTCFQSIDEEFKKKTIQKDQTELDELNSGLDKLGVKIKELYEKKDDIEKRAEQYRDLSHQQKLCRSRIDSLENDIEQLKTKKDETVEEDITQKDIDELEEYKTQLKEKQDELKGYERKRDYYNIINSMLKDDGMKARIIKKYIPTINKLVNHYLSKMDLFVKFTLDETFTESFKSRYLDTFTYDSFSEGQKKRIDLALLFCWREVARMKNSVNTNLLIFDEVLDASMDDEGCMEFLDMIDSLHKGVNTFIISHRGDAVKDKFRNIYEFDMKKGFTTIEKL